MVKFINKVLIIGYGSVAQCTLPVLLNCIDVPCSNISIIDFVDKREALAYWIAKGVNYFQERITRENLSQVLSKYCQGGDLIIDLAWNIDCIELLTWCHDNKVFYINTSVEEWDPCQDIHERPIYEKTLYSRQMEIRKLISGWNGHATTAIVDHGANPGLISHFAKKGLLDIAAESIRDETIPLPERQELEKLSADYNFPQLAMKLGVKVIHVSEHDTQITNRPKEVGEFVGTWSIEGLREEGVAPAEMGWGTHEKLLPAYAVAPSVGPKNQIFLAQMGMNTLVRSWVPNEEIIGMVIRHAESFSISDYLTVWEGAQPVYRPTVHYAYMPCNETISSLQELRMRSYHMQEKQRIMSDEIIKGQDVLGALLMGHKYNSWWTGSILNIEESRKLIPGQNATTIQVAIGVVSAVMWMLENPQCGVRCPDDLPHDYVLKIAEPYLGKLVSVASDWTPLKNYKNHFKENTNRELDKDNPWCFNNFLFRN